MIDFDADLLEMMDTDEFAQDITLVTQAVTIPAIFDSAHFEVSEDGITALSSFKPMVQIRTADENGVSLEDTVSINSVSYSVADVQPDGTGLTVLVLHKA